MNILGKLGVKSDKTSKPLGNNDRRELARQIMEAKIHLESAREKNVLIIETEKRKLKKSGNAAKRKGSVAKIKNAYYMTGVIDEVKMQLNDIETTQELFSALNDVTDAVQHINKGYKKAEKPHRRKFTREIGKLSGNMSEIDTMLSELYQEIEEPKEAIPENGIDQIVSNEIVKKLLDGASVEECRESEISSADLFGGDSDGYTVEDLGEVGFGADDNSPSGMKKPDVGADGQFDDVDVDFNDFFDENEKPQL